MSIKEITVPNESYITYTDPATGAIETVSASGDQGTELVVNGDFSDGFTGWSVDEPQWEIASEKARCTVAGSAGRLSKAKAFPSFDRVFHVGLTATSYTEGGLKVSFGGLDMAQRINGDGEYSFIGTPITYTTLYFGQHSATAKVDIDNISVKEVLPTATKYKMENDFGNAVSHDIPFSQADLDLMKADPLTLRRVWEGGLVLPSGFAKVNMKHFYPADEGVDGGANVHDLVTATDAVIQNYTDACRTTYQEVPCASIQPYPYSHR